MRRLFLQLKSFHRYAAMILLAVTVFQLGACPCGCLEHNAWFQLLGINTEHDDDRAATGVEGGSDVALIVNDDTHDCEGEARVQYFNNTRVPSLQEKSVAGGPVASTTIVVLLPNSIAAGTYRFQSGSTLAHAAALCRPALQVYRW
ncbi:MAG: hypothetical protein MPJ50_16990 [Pirellulales bacterium]|nr:hypothetical protein [Pirellulales bacterium]